MLLSATFSGRNKDDLGQSRWNVCGAGPEAVAVVQGQRAVDRHYAVLVERLGRG
jgi:hypothetical protein